MRNNLQGGTAMKKDSSGTASHVDGWYVEFQAAVLRALPRDIEPDVAMGWTKNGKALANNIRKVLMPPQDNGTLLLFSDNDIVIPSLSGKGTFSEVGDVILWLDPNFAGLKADESDNWTPETPIQIYDLVWKATLSRMFCSFSKDLNELCFTQDQILWFMRNEHEMGNLFLRKSYNNFFVVETGRYAGGKFSIKIYPFGHPEIIHRGRVVVPIIK